MRPRMTVLAAAVVTALASSVTACGQQPTTQPGAQFGATTAGPGMSEEEIRRQDATTSWADGYCRAVSELVVSLSTMPDIDPSSPQRASRTSSELLGVMVGGLDRTIEGLDRLEPAPSRSAEQVKANAVANYKGIRTSALKAKRALDAARDAEASRAAIGSVKGPLERIGRVNLLEGFAGVPELSQAIARAPACRQLTDKGPAPKFDNGAR
ncbi:hypothetical protein FHU38_000411 [Saccharomonospora amisosensis]|uniref:Lipoprotein n=1 Tax=Saccharomonospora amisosensis TaxID=1128677 RepID=A0A7X5UL77_9PSEU|nr:hypothetical protein [Saccharomonospora amisosensis]NIJ10067.1 hypothetical protein [Saccharomonospora amisosensis]